MALLIRNEDHMARRKTKKPQDRPGTPPQTKSARAPGQTAPAPQDRGDRALQAQSSSGGIRKSTCLMGMLATLVLGLYLGSLLPGLLNAPESPQPAARQTGATAQAQQPAASGPSPASAKDNQPPMPPELAQKIAELEKHVLADPHNAGSWAALGNLYFDTGQAKQAVSAYERSLAIVPDNADVLTDLGIMYRETGAFEKAVASFRKAVTIRPDHENARFNEGVVLYYDLHRKDEAVAAWKQLLAVNPGALSPDGKPVSELIKHLH
ncbi:tetratricopeptide repeat protein [Desulfovibrio sp. ZJ369]|uniref:tetratricopeptide repeat protein n=1 Tax=Desulfovibrio sp. ZJ369 TaxID=2709793 RepID=UPI001F14CFEA|nr:tetratricopeptide repeat protein [Desulfovibrio sp. ZJ369]